MKKDNLKRQTVIKWSLLLSTGYLFFGLCANFYATLQFKKELERQNITFEKIKIVPTPFNTILWQSIVKTKEGLYYADYSLLDSKSKIDFHYEKNDIEFINSKKNIVELEPFFNFTEGYELAKNENGKMHIYGTKFGPMNIENNEAKFIFPLVFNEDGTYELSQKRPDDFSKIVNRLFIRLKGN